MAAVESWTPIGGVDASEYNTTTPYKTVNPFKGIFDGQGFAVKNLNYTADMSTGKWGYAFFGSLDGATVRNLTLGDPDTDITWTFTGRRPEGDERRVAGRLCGQLDDRIVHQLLQHRLRRRQRFRSALRGFGSGRRDEELDHRRPRQVAGMRELRVRTHGQDHQQRQRRQRHADAGICGFMAKDQGNLIQFCVNYGHISCPTGRTGGLVATLMNGNVKNSDNRGTVEDDIVGKFEGAAAQNSYNSKRMGGLIGGTDDLKKVLTATVESCTNYGNVFTHIGCRTGGFIGHSNIRIIGCANQGAILGDVYNSDHGPAWACGYSGQSSGEWVNVSSCTMGGYVGSYTTYKDNPTSAPAATVHNAFSYKNDEYYDPTINN